MNNAQRALFRGLSIPYQPHLVEDLKDHGGPCAALLLQQVHFCTLTDPDGWACVSVRQLTNDLGGGWSRPHISRTLTKLEMAGFLERHEQKDALGRDRWRVRYDTLQLRFPRLTFGPSVSLGVSEGVSGPSLSETPSPSQGETVAPHEKRASDGSPHARAQELEVELEIDGEEELDQPATATKDANGNGSKEGNVDVGGTTTPATENGTWSAAVVRIAKNRDLDPAHVNAGFVYGCRNDDEAVIFAHGLADGRTCEGMRDLLGLRRTAV
jgi:hypothetical protein